MAMLSNPGDLATKDLRIVILGSGANGTSIGVDLTRVGFDVTLIEQWPAHVEAMRADGARIVMPEETLTQPVRAHHLCELPELKQKFDVALILVKAYDVRWASEMIAPYVEPNGVVVGVQNGMTADTVAEIVGAQRALGCVIEISSMMVEPGVVQRHSPPNRSWFAVGRLDESGPRWEGAVAELLGHSGTVEIVDDIRTAKWMKLVSNCNTLTTGAILGTSTIKAAGRAEMRDIMLRSGQEALDVGALLGYKPAPIFGLTADDIAQGKVAETFLDAIRTRFVLEETTSTVLHDWRKGRRSEIEEVNGLVVRTGAAYGFETPVNAAIVEVGLRIERGELEPGPANFDVLRDAIESRTS